MAKVAKRDEDETNTDICFDDIFYLSEVGTVHSKVTNDQKNRHIFFGKALDRKIRILILILCML